jgi:hypothetical protein
MSGEISEAENNSHEQQRDESPKSKPLWLFLDSFRLSHAG